MIRINICAFTVLALEGIRIRLYQLIKGLCELIDQDKDCVVNGSERWIKKGLESKWDDILSIILGSLKVYSIEYLCKYYKKIY